MGFYLDIGLIDFLIIECPCHANALNITRNKEKICLILVECSEP
jgi:hypothetical protein